MGTDVKIDMKIDGHPLPLRFWRGGSVFIRVKWITQDFLILPSGEQILTRERLSSPSRSLTFKLRGCSTRYFYRRLLRFNLENSVCCYMAPQLSSVANRMGFGLHSFDLDVEVRLSVPRFFVFEAETPFSGNDGASEEVIHRLRSEHMVIRSASEKNTDMETCTVCLDEYSIGEKLINMPCSHLFHESCIVEWLQTKNSCPLCRQIPYDEHRRDD